MNVDYFTTTEVAKVLGIPYWRIVYAHQSGKIPEPTLRIGNRRVYLCEDVLRLAKHFRNDLLNATWRQNDETRTEEQP